MKAIVIGLGNFGLNIATRLIKNNCEVLGIDSNREIIESVKDEVSHAICGNSSNKEVLESLNITDYDVAIIGIGQDMAASILISLYMKELGIPKIVARAISEDHGKVLTQLGINDVVFPEKDIAIKIANKLSLKNAMDFLPISDDYGIVEVEAPLSFIGKTLAELRISSKFNCQVIGIKYENKDNLNNHDRETVKTKIAPSATDILEEKSAMIVLGKSIDIDKLQSID
jgi:trk system potassium uptake protein TrkA